MRALLARLRSWEQSGSLYLGLGCATAAAAASLWCAGRLEVEQTRRLRAEFDIAASQALRAARHEQYEQHEHDRSRSAIWSGVLTRSQAGLNGPAMLPGARQGMRVEVLEEGVGDGGSYVRCREPGGTSGLYLRSWVARTDEGAAGGRSE